VTAVQQFPAAVAIVGAGAVAQALGRVMLSGGWQVVAVASRSRAHAEKAAQFIGAGASAAAASVRAVDVAEVPRVATRVLIAVADEGIAPVAEALYAAGMRSGIALHTCGAKAPAALRALGEAGNACGLLHPLQTIVSPEQGARNLADITFAVAGDPAAVVWAEQIATSLAGRPVRIDAGRLSYYHAGAVMGSNALIAALDAAVILLGAAGVDRDRALQALGPLATTSVANALAHGPQAALTGPVARGDAATVAAHVAAIQSVGSTVAELYVAAAAHLLQLAIGRGLSADRVRAVRAAIDEGSAVRRTVSGE
jgi:predicted short-subunit dehydrogenase-like oxidoreductase (DUF2520 family)